MSQTDDNKPEQKLTPEAERMRRAEHFAEMKARKQVIVGLILVINFLILVGGPICIYYVRKYNETNKDLQDEKSRSAIALVQAARDCAAQLEAQRKYYEARQQAQYDRDYAKWAERDKDMDEALKINQQMAQNQKAAKRQVRQAINKVNAITHESTQSN